MKHFRKISLYLLLLGSIWGNTHQVTADDKAVCNGTQYMDENVKRCCSRCPPGFYRKGECTESSDTRCEPCMDGTYTAKYNYATSCRRCLPCATGLIMRQPCNSTSAPDCTCEDGYTCARYNGVGDCRDCKPILNTTPAPTDRRQTVEPSKSPIDDYILWIVVPLCIATVVILALSCYFKACIVKTIGRIFKRERSVLSTPQAETAAFTNCADVTQAAQGYPVEPLLRQESNDFSMPMEEVGKVLSYPIQETDASQPGECTLNSV